MKKTLLAASLSLTMMAPAVMAHDTDGNHGNFSFGSEQCNLEFNNSLRLDKNVIEITDEDNQVMRIDNRANVYIEGKKVELSNAQRAAVSDYADGLREQLPQVADIALEGVKLASVALAEVSKTLDIPAFESLGSLMNDVSTEIHNSFYDGDTFVFDQDNLDAMGAAFGSEFEAKIEKAVEETMMESIGSILVAVGSELLSSGGDMNAMENKFENMGKAIEEKMEKEAAGLEKKAEALCGSFLVLAQQENELQSLLPGIKNYDLFTVKMGKN